MKKVTSSYAIGGVGCGSSLLCLEGDTPENDLIALKRFEEYVKETYKRGYHQIGQQQNLSLIKVVSSPIVSIPLTKTIKKEKVCGPSGETTLETYDAINPARAMVDIDEAKEYYESLKQTPITKAKE